MSAMSGSKDPINNIILSEFDENKTIELLKDQALKKIKISLTGLTQVVLEN